MPGNVKFYSSEGQVPGLQWIRPVTVGYELPSESGITQASTLYWRTLRLSDDKTWTAAEYVRAYKSVPLLPVKASNFLYVLVHFRGPDHNTYDSDRSHFCTQRVIHMLRTNTQAHLRVISNNYTDARKWLDGLPSIEIIHATNAFAAMQLALNAAAIVQHAPDGWSAFTSVPAMAKSIPLINTYDGRYHRHALFEHHGGLPAEFHTCRDVMAFLAAIMHRV
jgi:hypothetical protein